MSGSGSVKSELEDVKRHREVTRKQRDRKYTLSAAIVGYTNAGKSTLLNTLTGAGILAQDKLFATLDPTTRGLKLASGQEILLLFTRSSRTDTAAQTGQGTAAVRPGALRGNAAVPAQPGFFPRSSSHAPRKYRE